MWVKPLGCLVHFLLYFNFYHPLSLLSPFSLPKRWEEEEETLSLSLSFLLVFISDFLSFYGHSCRLPLSLLLLLIFGPVLIYSFLFVSWVERGEVGEWKEKKEEEDGNIRKGVVLGGGAGAGAWAGGDMRTHPLRPSMR